MFVQLRRRGVETKVLLTDDTDQTRTPDPTMVKLLAQAHCWATALRNGSATSVAQLAAQCDTDKGDLSRVLAPDYLAPDIVTAILEGSHPVELTASRLKRLGVRPPKWADQRALLGFL